MSPAVTIGMPVYNEEGFLRAALDSLLAQDFTDFELIVSDNASTDATFEIATEYAQRDPRVLVHRHPENVGAVQNFRSVVARARAPLFMWAAADDLWSSRFVGVLVEALQSHPAAGLAMSAVERRRDDGSLLDVVRFRGKDDPGHLSAYALLKGITSPRKYNLLMYGLFRTELAAPFAASLTDVLGWDRLLLCHVALATRIRYVDEVLQTKLYRKANEARYREKDRRTFQGVHRQQLSALASTIVFSPVVPVRRKPLAAVAVARYALMILAKPYGPSWAWPLVSGYLSSDGPSMSLTMRLSLLVFLCGVAGVVAVVALLPGVAPVVLALLLTLLIGLAAFQIYWTRRVRYQILMAQGAADKALRRRIATLPEGSGLQDRLAALERQQQEATRAQSELLGRVRRMLEARIAATGKELRYQTDVLLAGGAAPIQDKNPLARFTVQRQLKHTRVVDFARLSEQSRIRELYLQQIFPEVGQVEVPVGAVNELTGHANKTDMLFVCAVARLRQATRLFEFGTYLGRTTYHLTFASPEARVTTLNLPPEADPKYGRFIGRYFKGTTRAAQIEQIFEDSGQFDTAPFRAAFDFVFVDGDHEYEMVANDTRKAFELLAPGGVILWHDYAPKSGELVRFFRDFTQTTPLFRIKRTCLLMHIDGVDPLSFTPHPMEDTIEQEAYDADSDLIEELYHV